jgi:hypothetical protein
MHLQRHLTTATSFVLVTASFPVIAAALAIVAATGGQQAVPRELSALAAKVRLEAPVVSWCRGEFRAGRSGAFAVAVAPAAGGGRYLVLDADGTVVELGSFTGGPDLSCYTPDEARKLHSVIGQSETIQGRIVPRWRTTVVCGFVEDTAAVCWQHSPRDRVFVRVGEWVT